MKWCQRFQDGRTDLTDAERQGRPTTTLFSRIIHETIKSASIRFYFKGFIAVNFTFPEPFGSPDMKVEVKVQQQREKNNKREKMQETSFCVVL
ncbi:hypothetical protein AVEN_140068-1 [Araneus ventricosus]|uniref:Mos1 transposase HTH domain-containing protein n=1 Tax=Araneus ventricosus TaxID=182803 RepID=A0A4Y2QRG3_ARAVE|nr:hypothetical protein AVEN_140068-1 [Araneus ventricosus]